jgi:4-hydroxythreonine-4-phosphate dehydrogenase
MNFIFMLTRDDETVKHALEVFEAVQHTGLRYIGFKDVGLPHAELKTLAAAIRASGREVLLEVVSLDREAELRSARAALDLGVDWLLGGTRPDEVLPLIAGSGLKYCPFPGQIIGHPSLLRGSTEEIVASAQRISNLTGVYGLDLLAYRFDGDVPDLVQRVVQAVAVPVIAAGSVDSFERISTLASSGVWGFTIGSAIFEHCFGAGLAEQVEAVLAAVPTAANHAVMR